MDFWFTLLSSTMLAYTGYRPMPLAPITVVIVALALIGIYLILRSEKTTSRAIPTTGDSPQVTTLAEPATPRRQSQRAGRWLPFGRGLLAGSIGAFLLLAFTGNTQLVQPDPFKRAEEMCAQMVFMPSDFDNLEQPVPPMSNNYLTEDACRLGAYVALLGHIPRSLELPPATTRATP